ncbi:MAG: type 4a pilus biogenesis protein PilO [Acidobacteriota bacterium]|nr:type 4a pilus biogenesis protein PilO [Acidobacteriota bacterium]MDQ7087191.1 type 4a pilus biogenesis protein PilO [Acidobacteriota bacterium]
MDFKNMPWWGHLILAAVVGGVLIWLSYSMAPANLSAKKAKIEDLTTRIEDTQAKIRQGKLALAKLDELERDIAALELKLADLKAILPTEPELGDLLKWIKSLADQANLDLRLFNPQPLQEQELLKEQPIRMNVVGTYHQLGMFFDRVSKHARIINVENVRITPNTNRSVRTATIAASFVAKTFIFREDAAAAEGGAP